MIGIIGAGLAGLTAGKVLSERGVSYTLIEASEGPGGRVKSDLIDGFIFDHGFQVLLNSYPQVQKHLDLKDLKLKKFKAGAKIFLGNGQTVTVSDPLRSPEKLLETLLSPIGTLSDKLKILKLRNQVDSSETKTTYQLLKEMGFSDKMIESFFRPFFSGVFLEKELETPASFFQFIYQRFARGYASLPEKGMNEIAKQLMSKNKGTLVFNSEVTKITAGEKVIVETKETNFEFDKVIVALDSNTCSKLLPDLSLDSTFRKCTTQYFSCNKRNDEGYLYLNASKKGIVNHIAPLSSVQPGYCKEGVSLYSVTILNDQDISSDEVLAEIKSWNSLDVSDWKFVGEYKVPYALPKTFYNAKLENPYSHITIAGDFTETPSIEGAMLSGEKAARLI
jgi:protoporphyrinogen oxidase